jgi:hypothetical protein
MADFAISHSLHAVNHHQHELFERNEILVKGDYFHCHAPITLAVLYAA